MEAISVINVLFGKVVITNIANQKSEPWLRELITSLLQHKSNCRYLLSPAQDGADRMGRWGREDVQGFWMFARCGRVVMMLYSIMYVCDGISVYMDKIDALFPMHITLKQTQSNFINNSGLKS
jgi:hypothetical protein